MAQDNNTRAATLLNQLRSGQDTERHLKAILGAILTPELRSSFININIFGVLRYKGIAEQLQANYSLVASIKLLLCKESSYTRFIAFEIDLLREALDFVFIYVQSKPSNYGTYLPLSHISAEFGQLDTGHYELLAYYILIMAELGSHDDDVVKEINKYNILPRLLFIIEKAPLNISVGDMTLRKCAQKLLNLILAFIDVANGVCVKLDLFRWLLRIAKKDLYKAKELEMIEALSLLSFSDDFVPILDEELIVQEWVYKNLCMILIPEYRNDEFSQLNQSVVENDYLKLVSYLSQILGNVSRSQGGMEKIRASISQYKVDVIWRIHYLLIKANITDFNVWYTLLYLTNNVLRYPYYKPPLYASE